MKVLKEKQGQDVCNNIFFIHAILGCDTTSRLHGVGKGTFLKKFCESHHFRNQAKVFNNASASEKKLLKLVRKLWFAFTKVNLAEPWIVLDTDDNYCQKVATHTSHRICHLFRPQQCITVYLCTFRPNNGRELMQPRTSILFTHLQSMQRLSLHKLCTTR